MKPLHGLFGIVALLVLSSLVHADPSGYFSDDFATPLSFGQRWNFTTNATNNIMFSSGIVNITNTLVTSKPTFGQGVFEISARVPLSSSGVFFGLLSEDNKIGFTTSSGHYQYQIGNSASPVIIGMGLIDSGFHNFTFLWKYNDTRINSNQLVQFCFDTFCPPIWRETTLTAPIPSILMPIALTTTSPVLQVNWIAFDPQGLFTTASTQTLLSRTTSTITDTTKTAVTDTTTSNVITTTTSTSFSFSSSSMAGTTTYYVPTTSTTGISYVTQLQSVYSYTTLASISTSISTSFTTLESLVTHIGATTVANVNVTGTISESTTTTLTIPFGNVTQHDFFYGLAGLVMFALFYSAIRLYNARRPLKPIEPVSIPAELLKTAQATLEETGVTPSPTQPEPITTEGKGRRKRKQAPETQPIEAQAEPIVRDNTGGPHVPLPSEDFWSRPLDKKLLEAALDQV